MMFIGYTVPVRGDIPIFVNVDDTRNSLAVLERLPDSLVFYPAWDKEYSSEIMRDKIADAINELKKLLRYIPIEHHNVL